MARHRAAIILVPFVAAIILAAGCATGASESMRFNYGEAAAEAAAEAGSAGMAEPAPAAPASRGLVADTQPGPSASSPTTERPEGARLRVYSADLTLSVGGIETARREIISLAERLGGYVETATAESVTIRIPAAEFATALDRVEAVGTVEERAVRTVDVTEQFTDLERRLEVAERSRVRLLELLERAEEAEERVAILREIRRLTEEIETLRASLASLGDLIRYSRITVRLVSRLAGRGTPVVPFDWIAMLDPLRVRTERLDRPVEIDLGDAYAVFESGRRYRAETAAGARVRLGGVENEPRGDTEFWAQAVRFHLASRFPDASAVSAGNFEGAVFGGAGSYRYLVLVAVRGAEIVVAEAFVPESDDGQDRIEEVVAALAEVSL